MRVSKGAHHRPEETAGLVGLALCVEEVVAPVEVAASEVDEGSAGDEGLRDGEDDENEEGKGVGGDGSAV